MKEATYFEDWSSSCSGSEPQRAIQVLGGDQWEQAYAVADKHGVVVVGGNAQSVGAAGGYTTGGGHSA